MPHERLWVKKGKGEYMRRFMGLFELNEVPHHQRQDFMDRWNPEDASSQEDILQRFLSRRNGG